ncbi:MAG: PP2C family protein-serine/threonine phosphatase [Planctomycetota bacterium]
MTEAPIGAALAGRSPGKESRISQHHEMQCMEVWGGNDATESSVAMPGVDAWVYSRPCGGEAQGGDVHYLTSCATGRVTRMLLADISGHGISVASMGLSLRQLLRRFINQISQRRVVRSLNRHFADIADEGVFATALVATFFAPRRTLDLTNAGHPPPLLYRAAARRWRYLHQVESGSSEIANVPLGVDNRTTYSQQSVALDVGDLVLCYTDSLPESVRDDGSRLGLLGLLDLVQGLDADHPDRIVPALIEQIRHVCPSGTDEDDLTMLLIRPTGEASSLSFGEALRGLRRITREMLVPARRIQ